MLHWKIEIIQGTKAHRLY